MKLTLHPSGVVQQSTHIGEKRQHACCIEGLFVRLYLEPHIWHQGKLQAHFVLAPVGKQCCTA